MEKHLIMKRKHLVLSIAAVIMVILIIVFSIFSAMTASATEKKEIPQRSEQQAYPVTLPTMSLVGITAPCDGTIDGRRNTLANLWTEFGKTNAFNNDPAIYRKKIYVVFYNHQPTQTKAYSIFIGYSIINWLRGELTLNNQSLMIMDIPKGDYYGYDVRGTSINSIIKSWGELYTMQPNGINHRAIEVYTLDSDNYTVQNVTLYLKKQ